MENFQYKYGLGKPIFILWRETSICQGLREREREREREGGKEEEEERQNF